MVRIGISALWRTWRNSNRHEILAAFERRLRNDREQEFAQAIHEIHKIARMRLETLFRESNAA
jgi:2-oxo-4-hydroxy-4-carboxy--5-ureidoimidazoline (OHCU) decarboxylase